VWTDSCLSIAGAGCGLTGVGAGEEQARKVVAGEASRCGEDKWASFEDPVTSGVKCGPHGGMNSKMKSWTVSWLSLKTKVEPGLHGSRVMSGDWRRLHRVHGVSGGSPENHWVPWLIHKAKTGEPKTELLQRQTGLTGGSDRSDHAARNLRSGGHTSGSHGLRRGYAGCGRRASVRW
jgi:hypothetical protein